MAKKKEMSIVGIVILILVIAGGFVLYSFVAIKPTIKLSCEDGKLLGFGKTSFPLMCAGCIPQCQAGIEVSDNTGNLVCVNTYKDDKVVSIPCLDLKKYKGQELTIKYWINSSSGDFSGEEKLVYER